MSRDRAQQLVEAGIWLKLSGDREGARKLFERALKLDPGNEKATQLLAGGEAEVPPPPEVEQPAAPPPPTIAPVANPFEAPANAPPSASELDWGMATGFSSGESPVPQPAAPTAVPSSSPTPRPQTMVWGSSPVPQRSPLVIEGDAPTPRSQTMKWGSSPVPQASPLAIEGDAQQVSVPPSRPQTMTWGRSPVPSPSGEDAPKRSQTMVWGTPESQGAALVVEDAPAVPPGLTPRNTLPGWGVAAPELEAAKAAWASSPSSAQSQASGEVAVPVPSAPHTLPGVGLIASELDAAKAAWAQAPGEQPPSVVAPGGFDHTPVGILPSTLELDVARVAWSVASEPVSLPGASIERNTLAGVGLTQAEIDAAKAAWTAPTELPASAPEPEPQAARNATMQAWAPTSRPQTISLSGEAPAESPPRSTPPLFSAPPPLPEYPPREPEVVRLPSTLAHLEPPASQPSATVELSGHVEPEPPPPSTPPIFGGTVPPEPARTYTEPLGFAWSWSASPPPTEPIPEPRPSPTLAPRAESAWDARSNPGIKLEAVVGQDRALDLISSDSKIVNPAQARKDEINTILRGARDLLDLDDHTGAMELIVKAQTIAPDDPDVVAMRERSEKTLLAMFESKLGKLETIPRVLLKDDEIIWLNLDHRAGFVLAQIDGTVSFDDLFSVSGMSRIDTARILAQLVEEGVISRG